MLRPERAARVFLYSGVVDMRKSIDGLSLIVSEYLDLDPLSSSLFVFCNRQKNKIKILHWDGTGFWLFYKRLEKSRFQWPQVNNKDYLTLTRQQLGWLLDGLTLEQTQAHRKLNYQSVT